MNHVDAEMDMLHIRASNADPGDVFVCHHFLRSCGADVPEQLGMIVPT